MKTETASSITAPAGERVFEGLGVSPGIIVGPAHLRDSSEIQVLEYRLPKAKINDEVIRFKEAVEKARRQVDTLKSKAEGYHGAAAEELGYLLDAHLQMLRSNSLLGAVEKRIRDLSRNAEAAVMAEIGEISKNFAEMDDPYLRARSQEVREVGMRIVRNLTNTERGGFDHLAPGSIVIAEEITPADTALMDPKRIGGFATDLGGAEGHTAIMARSLGLPAVLGVTGLFAGIRTGDSILVDGTNGLVIVNPTEKRLSDYKLRRAAIEREFRSLALLRDVAATTRDGQSVGLQANLELPRDLVQAIASGAQGVGLLRTEFMFMNRDDLPGENEQYEALKTVVEGMDGHPVTIRTLDIGGEKLTSSLSGHAGSGLNPALGLRAIRLSLKDIPLFEAQLSAILRAGAHGPVRILLPMISNVAEVKEVRKILTSVAERLTAQGVRIADPLPPLGVMIEIPGAALAADALAQVADFFAIGTNDLTMYTLAIDRSEEQVAHLYNPLHPAVLRLIQFSVEAALRARIPVSVCGEVAGDPRFTALLLGLGVRDLSMSATALPRIKKRILKIDLRAASRRAMAIMDQHDSGRIAALLDDFNESH
jgi:phosphotransferase system enzyme I (PtsI)